MPTHLYLASDPLPYAPRNLEQAQFGIGALILLILAWAVFSSSNGKKASAKPPVRRKAGNATGVILALVAVALLGKSHGDTGASNPAPPAPKPQTTTSQTHKPDSKPTSSGNKHCSFICFEKKD